VWVGLLKGGDRFLLCWCVNTSYKIYLRFVEIVDCRRFLRGRLLFGSASDCDWFVFGTGDTRKDMARKKQHCCVYQMNQNGQLSMVFHLNFNILNFKCFEFYYRMIMMSSSFHGNVIMNLFVINYD